MTCPQPEVDECLDQTPCRRCPIHVEPGNDCTTPRTEETA